jgi:two-component system OmpR family response regulator
MRVLVVEDERKLGQAIREGLQAEDLLVDLAESGEDALWMVPARHYDVVCLDVNLPGRDGFEVSRRLRAGGVTTPILMLTARDGIEDRITGLDTGADDYLVKPFDLRELQARLRALARRGQAGRGPVLRVGDLTLDPATRRVARGDVEIALSAKELQLLEVFMRRPGELLTRFDLLEGAWDGDYVNRSNVISVYVRYLREKIDRPFGLETLQTVRGLGYVLRSREDDPYPRPAPR